MAGSNGGGDDDIDSLSSCSDTTLGDDTSVDLLLGLRRRLPKPIIAAWQEQQPPPQKKSTAQRNQSLKTPQIQNHQEGSPLTSVSQPSQASKYGIVGVGDLKKKSTTTSIKSPPKQSDSSSTLCNSNHESGGMDSHYAAKTGSERGPPGPAASESPQSLTSPPTQTLNELSQMSTSCNGNDASGDHDLMFDMSQLSQISIPGADGEKLSAARRTPAGVGPMVAEASSSDSMVHDARCNLGVVQTGAKAAQKVMPNKFPEMTLQSSKSSRREEIVTDEHSKRLPKTSNSTGRREQGNDGGDDRVSSTFHYITLPRPKVFGMDVAETQNTTKSQTFTCVAQVRDKGQAAIYGVQRGDLIYHPPNIANLPRGANQDDLDQYIQRVCRNLKPVSLNEIAQWSESTVRPVTFVIERMVEIGTQDEPIQCSITKLELRKALQVWKFPKMPCCRKCHYPSLEVKNHHFYCSKHSNFGDSGAREKLVILLAGALYGCRACISEIEHGKKNSKILHSFRCQIVSNVGKKAGAGALGGAAGKAVAVGKSGSKSVLASTGLLKKNVSKGVDSNHNNSRARSSGTASEYERVAKKATVATAAKKTTKRKLSNASKNPPVSKKIKAAEVFTAVSAPKADRLSSKAVVPVNSPKSILQNRDRTKGKNPSRREAVTEGNSNRQSQSSTNVGGVKPQQKGIPITPAVNVTKTTTQQDSVRREPGVPLLLTDDASVSKWVPCTNPWGDRAYCDGDFVLFSPEDYQTSFEMNGSKPKRFVTDPFELKCKSAYSRTHQSQEDGGFQILQLSRDRLALRSWGFSFCCHDFGGACLVVNVEPMSPADSAELVSSGSIRAPLRTNDMIICVNNKNVGGLTEVEVGVLLDMSGSDLSLVVSRFKKTPKLESPSWVEADASENLHWNEIGVKKFIEKCETTQHSFADSPFINEVSAIPPFTEGGSAVGGDKFQQDNEPMNISDHNETIEWDTSDVVELEEFEAAFGQTNHDESMSQDECQIDALEMSKPASYQKQTKLFSFTNEGIVDKSLASIPGCDQTHSKQDSVFGEESSLALTYKSISDQAHDKEALTIDDEASLNDDGQENERETLETVKNEPNIKSASAGGGIGLHHDKRKIEEMISSLDIENLPSNIKPIHCVANKSGYRGLKELRGGLWGVDILVNNTLFHLGKYRAVRQAATLYAWAYRTFHGETALQELYSTAKTPFAENVKKLEIKNLPASVQPVRSKMNPTGFKGVARLASSRFQAVSYCKKERISIGSFASAIDAGRMYAWAYQTVKGPEALHAIQMEGLDDSEGEHVVEHDVLQREKDRTNTKLLQNEIEDKLSDSESAIVLTSHKNDASLLHQEEDNRDVDSTSEEEPEWDDDSNPWLGCVCGETHDSPTPVFWIQCDSCNAWYNCFSACLGFDKHEAEHQQGWECPECTVFDGVATKKIASVDVITPIREKCANEENSTIFASVTIPVGTIVDVQDRTWSGSNKYGGVARVSGYNSENGIFYDVRYVLDNRFEAGVESKYVSVNYNMITQDFTSPRITRSCEKSK